MKDSNQLKIRLAQIAPVWLNKDLTREKIRDYLEKAGKDGCELVVFGEALLPGYPFWLGLTHGSDFNSPMQKEIHAHYVRNAIVVEKGELDMLCAECRNYKMAAYVGIIERAQNRGGQLYTDRERICMWPYGQDPFKTRKTLPASLPKRHAPL